MDQEAEIKRLKVKCNRQLDEIVNLRKMVEDQKGKLKKLQKSNSAKKGKVLAKVIDEKTDNFSDKNPVEEYAKNLIQIIGWLQDGKLFINYKNACKNSKEFYRLASDDFKGIAEKFIKESEMNKFYKFCAGIGVIRSNSYIFNYIIQGRATKVIFIRKSAFEVIQDDR